MVKKLHHAFEPRKAWKQGVFDLRWRKVSPPSHELMGNFGLERAVTFLPEITTKFLNA